MNVKFLKHLLTPDQITDVHQITSKDKTNTKKGEKVCQSKQFVKDSHVKGNLVTGSMRRSGLAGTSPRCFFFPPL